MLENQSRQDKEPLPFILNGIKHHSNEQYISGKQLREIGKIPSDHEIFLAIEGPWEDEHIKDDTDVDLARPGIEHFFSKRHGEDHIVTIYVNNVEKKITRGNHSVADIKKLGEVPVSNELEEVKDGKFIPLDDNKIIFIKGGEKFIGHVRDGSSS